MNRNKGLWLPAVLAACLAGATPPLQAQADTRARTEQAAEEVVARVNGDAISFGELRTTVGQAIRQKFYHGAIPEGEGPRVARETLRTMIDERLLVAEATRRGLKPSETDIEQAVARWDRQYGSRPNWPQMRAQALPELRAKLARQSLVAQLEAAIRDKVAKPGDAEVRRFYQDNPQLFTEPERLSVSMIQLPVDPSSPQTVWQAVEAEGERIRAEIGKGAPFGDLAREHSSHPSAPDGGKLGYVHQGMMPEADKLLAEMKAGEVSPAFRALEGVMIIRLDERIPAKLRSYADVRGRAGELLLRDRRDMAWNGFRENLYNAADVSVKADSVPELKGFVLPKR